MRNFIGCIKLNFEEDEWIWHLCQFYFPLANVELSMSDSQGWRIHFLYFSHHKVKLAETFNWLSPSYSWSCGLMKSVTRLRPKLYEICKSSGSWASWLYFCHCVISFKLHLQLSFANIFILGEIKHIFMLWHLGVINDTQVLHPCGPN